LNHIPRADNADENKYHYMKLLPTITVPNFLSSEEIELVKTMIQQDGRLNKLERDGNFHAHIWALATNGNKHPVEELILSKLKSILPCNTLLYDVWWQQQRKPHKFHTDYYHPNFEDDTNKQPDSSFTFHENLYGNRLPYYTLLIPTDDDAENFYTVLSNESSITPNLDDCIKNKSIRKLPEEQQISKEFFNRYLSHCPPHERVFFSLHQNVQWEKGKLLAFDRRRWHASHNYLADNISHKHYITSFSLVDPDEYRVYIDKE
jgi:hypothetical protein